jgi:hypothetical protein
MRTRGISLALLTVCSVATASAQYKPAAGDYMEVIRKTFKPGKLGMAKKLMLNKIHNLHSRDGLVRNLIVGENAGTNELVGIILSNAYNRGNWTNKNAYPEIEPILLKATRDEHKVFAVQDEGATIKSGDVMRIYWHRIKSDKHEDFKQAFAKRMIPALQKDDLRTNCYWGESEKPGLIVGVAIGNMPSTPQPHRNDIAHLEKHRTAPIKIENLRVILVRYEGK